MEPFWGDMNARIRGLSLGLLRRDQLEVLARSEGLDALGHGLDALGLAPLPGGASAAELERGMRRRSGARLRLLARWAGEHRRRLLAGLFEDEDRRSLRLLVRGLVAGASPEARLEGLVPTPSLPQSALAELAACESLHQLAGLLLTWRSPWGPVFVSHAQGAVSDLFGLEIELDRAFSRRARWAARGAGRHLREYFARLVDLANATTALLLAGRDEASPPARFFVDGGTDLGRTEYTDAIERGTEGVQERLARSLAGGVLAPLLSAGAPPTPVSRLETEGLRWLLRHERRCARLDPLGTAPIVGFFLRLRAEMVDVSRLIWGVAMSAPAELLTGDLATVAW